MSTRRASRNHDGVRLCEANGTVSTAASRAAERMDSVRTKAIAYSRGIR